LRHRIKRQTFGKTGVKHASSLIGNQGQGSSVFAHVIYNTDVGARSNQGGVQSIRDVANTEETCLVGDIVKYVNICIECAPRGANPTNDNDNAGWLEWAVGWQEERDVDPATTNLGVASLGVVVSHYLRENCFMTGCFPLGTKQAMSQDIKIKLPQKCVKLKVGAILKCWAHVRTSSSTDVRTDSHRLLISSQFKAYS